MKLSISADLALPADYVTKTVGILAQRRKGKTYTASVIAEEFVDAGQPFVALDPTGAWWGLRASADGKKDGLPVTIFGGQHGDIPLERTMGKELAEYVVEQPGFYVLDLSLFPSKEAERELATDFAEKLYRRKGQPGGDEPLHLFVDEADMFVPQQSPSGDKRMLGAFEALVRRGGLRGIGTTLISQRTAVVNKNVLEQLDMLIVLRTVGPNDRQRIDEYVRSSGTEAQRQELMGSLSSLAIGEAWVWEPGAEPALYAKVKIRQRRTYNSSATPKPGERSIEPQRLADVDLEVLKERFTAAVEKAKADDPKELRRQIAGLRKELQQLQKTPAQVEPVVEYVDVPFMPQELRASIDRLVMLTQTAAEIASLREEIEALLAGVDVTVARAPTTRGTVERTKPVAQSPKPQARPAPRRDIPTDTERLPEGELKILTAAAQHADGVTREQLTILTTYKRSTRDAYIQRLRGRDLLDVRGTIIHATQAGLDTLGPDFEPLPTGGALRDYWLARLPEGEAKILAELVDAYPAGRSREQLSDTTGYKRSTRDAYIQRLRTRQLVVIVDGDPRASDVLFEES